MATCGLAKKIIDFHGHNVDLRQYVETYSVLSLANETKKSRVRMIHDWRVLLGLCCSLSVSCVLEASLVTPQAHDAVFSIAEFLHPSTHFSWH